MSNEERPKVAIVTGARQGIGRQLASELSARGFSVIVTARHEADDTVAEIRTHGGEVVFVPADIAQPGHRLAVVDAAVRAFGAVDVLINNAAYTTGPAMFTSIDDLSLDDWHHQFHVNLDAPLQLSQRAIPVMRSGGRGGVIVNLSSPAAVPRPVDTSQPNPYGVLFGYEATKAALERFTNSLAAALVGDRIAVLGVDPGLVATETTKSTLEQLGVDGSSAIPSWHIAKFIADLLPDAMSHTGEVLRTGVSPLA
jgi:NAD(P)-dependent dehydrogenase (short-subunit alcohol dehydrogenase family)